MSTFIYKTTFGPKDGYSLKRKIYPVTLIKAGVNTPLSGDRRVTEHSIDAWGGDIFSSDIDLDSSMFEKLGTTEDDIDIDQAAGYEKSAVLNIVSGKTEAESHLLALVSSLLGDEVKEEDIKSFTKESLAAAIIKKYDAAKKNTAKAEPKAKRKYTRRKPVEK